MKKKILLFLTIGAFACLSAGAQDNYNWKQTEPSQQVVVSAPDQSNVIFETSLTKRPPDTRTVSGCESSSSAASKKIRDAYCGIDEHRQDPNNIFPNWMDNGYGGGCWYWSVTFVCNG